MAAAADHRALRCKGMTDYGNRLRKNARHLARWAKRNHVECYRLYDCDVPRYPLTVDLYQTDHGARVHLQEVDTGWQQSDEEHQAWLALVESETGEVLGVPSDAIALKRRSRQRVGKALDQQYQATGRSGQDLIVREGPARLIVNLDAYLDTGLFLDHRVSRHMVRERAHDRRFLNLFAYTASFSVHAALGGASSSVSVDLSNTYCDWARRNLVLNSVDTTRHIVTRADVLVWLKDEVARAAQYDLIVLDPPSFSNSKKMTDVLDVQRDHVQLVDWCMSLLSDHGELLFSNNLRSFVLDDALAKRYLVEDITQRSIPEDFRDKKIHHAFIVRPAAGA
jgi:23S rRNA (cytosine1962-C5)-methyltransferase